ncbi:MAG: TonB-dependent receptor [Bacteroidota bacterium]
MQKKDVFPVLLGNLLNKHRTMKLSCLLFLLALVNTFANSYAQTKKLSLDIDQETIENVIKNIESQSKFKFFYKTEEVDVQRKISLKVVDTPIKEILEILFSDKGVTYTVVKKQIVLKRVSLPVKTPNTKSQVKEVKEIEPLLQRSVSGTVTDANGTPLPGVSIIEKGTTNGVATDFDGNYSIEVSSSDVVLVYSYLGFETKEIVVGQSTTLNVSLSESAEGLEEVVVIGYGTQRKKDLTGSTVGIKAEEIQDVPVNSFEQSLQGRIAGVQITQANAAPGGGVSVKIRGTNSISGNSEPLYVIDGIPIISDNRLSTPGGIGGTGPTSNDQNALATLNPNDIEDIQVLKDASATAIYGARGANGVVIITTKRGKPGKPVVNIDMYAGIQSPVGRIDVASPNDFVTAVQESFGNSTQPLPVSEEELNNLLNNATDYQDLAFTDAIIRNVQLSVSGATDTDLNYFLSVNNFLQDGIVRTSGFERNSFRMNLEKGFNRFRVGTNFSYSRTDSDIVLAGNTISIPRFAVAASPLQPIFDENGEFLHQTILGGGNSANIESLFQGATDNLISDRLLGSLFAEYEFTNSLKFRTTLGVDIDRRDREVYYDRNTGPRFGGTDFPGWAQQAGTSSTQLVTTNTLTYSPEISNNHRLTLTGVFEAQTFETSSISVTNRGFASDVLGADAISSGTQPGGAIVDNAAFKWQLASWVARAFYSFKDRYLLNATVRYDGSSRFGGNNQWGTFPSVGIGWKVNEEGFLRNVESLDLLKLRGSYGITGNQEIGVLQTAERFVPTTGAIFADQLVNTVDAVSFANPNLKWEESSQINVGLDAAMFDNRLNLNLDYYKRTTSDLLLAVNIAPSSGFASPVFNAGEIENRGFEIAMNSTLVQKDDFQWNLGLNFSRNRNEVLRILSERDFGPEIQQFVPGSLIEEGRPLGVFFGYETNGIYATQEEADADLPNGSLFEKDAGEYRYVDLDGDGDVDPDDRTVIGDPNPDFTYGINTSLKYKNFSLDMTFQGVQGVDILWTNAQFLYASSIEDRHIMQERFDNRWTPENPNNAQFPKFDADSDVRGTLDDRVVFDGSFFRLRNVVLGYELPGNLLERLRIQRTRIYISGTNLFTITDYPGFNPDISTLGQNTVNIGVDQSGYPLARSIQLGLNITL